MAFWNKAAAGFRVGFVALRGSLACVSGAGCAMSAVICIDWFAFHSEVFNVAT